MSERILKSLFLAARTSALTWRSRNILHASGFVSLASGCVYLGPASSDCTGINFHSDHSRRRLHAIPSDITRSSWSVHAQDNNLGPQTVANSPGNEKEGTQIWDQISEIRRQLNYAGEAITDGVQKRLQSQEGRVVLSLIATNVLVFALWKILPTSFMVRHFASSLEAMRRGRVWTALTCNFSHMGVFHLAANMYLLDTFGREVAQVLTTDRFVVLYVAGGLASALASLASRRILRNNVLSLGASGSVAATMFMFASLFPERELWIMGLWKLHARDAMVLWAMVDAAGLLGSFGKIDFAAHLGGAVFSYGYYNVIRETLCREYSQRRHGQARMFRPSHMHSEHKRGA